MNSAGKKRWIVALLALALIVHCVRETRPKAFAIESVSFRDGAPGTVASNVIWLLTKTGNIEIKEFNDNGFYTSARISILGDEMEFIGLPFTGKFYRLDDSQNSSVK